MTEAMLALVLFVIFVPVTLLLAFLGDRTGHGLDVLTREWREVRVVANVTFLSEEQGGRRQPAWNSRTFRTQAVIGDYGQHLNVCFDGDGKELANGVEHQVLLVFTNRRDVEYDQLVPGATFTLGSGGRIDGYGSVVRGPLR